MLRIRATAKLAVPLLIVLLSLCLYSNSEYSRHLPYPSLDEIASNYQLHVGGMVSISGTVTSSARNSSVVSAGKWSFEVSPLVAKVGDKAEVLGRLKSNYRITAEKVVVQDSAGYYSIFLRSLIGAGLLAFVFLKSWKFDAKRFRFEGRG